MNEIADCEANGARAEAEQSEVPYELAGEERVCMRVPGVPVIGSYRREILRAGRKAALDRMAELQHQGRLAREHCARLLAYCTVAARSHDPYLMRFVTLACATWLPTERARLSTSRKTDNINAGRGEACKLCGGVRSGVEETMEHALCHCSGNDALVRCREGVISATAALIAEPARPDEYSRPGDPGRRSGGDIMTPAWFDPSGRTVLRLCPWAHKEALEGLKSFPILAGIMGVLPPGLDEVMGWARAPGGGWVRLGLAATQARIARLRGCLMYGARNIWRARCRACDRWWHSGGTARYVERRAEALAQAAVRRHAWKKER